MVCCYTHAAINDIAVADATILQKLNRNANFGALTHLVLQGMLFIVLARILDTNPDVHSLYQLLKATQLILSSLPERASSAQARRSRR